MNILLKGMKKMINDIKGVDLAEVSMNIYKNTYT
jgi:hypothetical protein